MEEILMFVMTAKTENCCPSSVITLVMAANCCRKELTRGSEITFP
jgi:hypothetical protein